MQPWEPQPARGGTMRYPALAPEPTTLRGALDYLRSHSAGPSAPPGIDHGRSRFLWGLAQPLLGVRIMLKDRTLLGEALLPVGTITVICVIAAMAASSDVEGGELTKTWRGVAAFFATFIALAPVPPFLFARHYAKMAARARNMLELGPCDPYLESLPVSAWKTIAQTIVIAIGVAPLTILLGIHPLGTPMAVLVQGAWTLHWMVIEGLDNGRTLVPGTTVAQVTKADEAMRHDPWYFRWLDAVKHNVLVKLLVPVRMLGEVVRALGRSWSPEVRIVEREHAVCGGFGLGVVVLLGVPGLNLFFRPALAIGAAHLRAQLERERAAVADAITG